MFRLPKGEQLDRLVAGGLVVQGQLEVWLAPTSRAQVARRAVHARGRAVDRGAPALAARVGLAFLSTLTVILFVVAGPTRTPWRTAVSCFCALYAVAVWTDTRGFLMGTRS